MKIMTEGTKDAKGTTFFEDYTYNLVKGKEGILQAHMLEICPSIADGKIAIKECPLSMGNREDPARLVFTAKEGHGMQQHSGHQNQILKLVQQHGFMQEERIIQHFLMT